MTMQIERDFGGFKKLFKIDDVINGQPQSRIKLNFFSGFFPKRSTSKVQIFEKIKSPRLSESSVKEIPPLTTLNDVKKRSAEPNSNDISLQDLKHASTDEKNDTNVVRKSSSAFCFGSTSLTTHIESTTHIETINETKSSCSKVTTV